MKFFGKLLLTLLLLLLLAIAAIYVVLQTQWGAGWLSRQISNSSPYQLSLSKAEHDFSNPSHLVLSDVSFGRDGYPAILVAKRVDLGLTLAQFSNPLHFSSIRLERGTLDLDRHSEMPLFQSDRLQLSQMTVRKMLDEWPVEAQQVNGAILPWQPKTANQPERQMRFQLSAGSLKLKGLLATNALIEGSLTGKDWSIDNLSADVARGSIMTSAKRSANGRWQVNNLRLNGIGLQSDKTLSEFIQPLLSLPDVHFNRVDITGARLEGKNWAITDLDLVLKDLTLLSGNWQSNGGSLEMNASSVVNGGLQLNDPIASMDFSRNGVEITRFSSRWVNGLIRAAGSWDRSKAKLNLDEVVITGLEYTLPSSWRDDWMTSLPDWLDSIEISQLSANRNLLIDINPGFPFQLTALDGTGSKLLLAKNHQWGVWAGTLSLNAAEATFNRVDLRHPSLTLVADNRDINVTKMSAFSAGGMLELTASMTQQPNRAFSFTLNGRQVAVNLLQNWGWPQLPGGKGNVQMRGQGTLQQDRRLKETINATLSATPADIHLQQRMTNGVVNDNR